MQVNRIVFSVGGIRGPRFTAVRVTLTDANAQHSCATRSAGIAWQAATYGCVAASELYRRRVALA